MKTLTISGKKIVLGAQISVMCRSRINSQGEWLLTYISRHDIFNT